MRIANEIDVKIGDQVYQISSDDDYLNHIGSGFEAEMVKLFDCLIEDDDVVLDIGANIGFTSILFGQLASEVLSFEPSPSTFSFLDENIAKSGLTNIRLSNCGLGAQTGVSEITFSPANRAGAFVSDKTQACAGFAKEEIVIRRLDDVIAELGTERIDFVKIDVEGFEKHVIEGGMETVKRFKPIVTLELNHWCLNAFQRTSVPDFFDFLRGVFPVLYAIDAGCYADLHDAGESYIVMYHHIIHRKYENIVACFDPDQLGDFFQLYQHKTL